MYLFPESAHYIFIHNITAVPITLIMTDLVDLSIRNQDCMPHGRSIRAYTDGR